MKHEPNITDPPARARLLGSRRRTRQLSTRTGTYQDLRLALRRLCRRFKRFDPKQAVGDRAADLGIMKDADDRSTPRFGLSD